MTKSQKFFCGLGKFYLGAVIVCGIIATVDAIQTNKAIAKLKSDPFESEWPVPSCETLAHDAECTPIPIKFQLGAAFR